MISAPVTIDGFQEHEIAPYAALVAAMDPWRRLGIPAIALQRQFSAMEYPITARALRRRNELIGAMVIRDGWLRGPYLQHLSVIPDARGHGAGETALRWLSDHAAASGHGNVWLCVSSFNLAAQRFYEKQGFHFVANLDGLVHPDYGEILMRRKLPS